MPFINDDCKTLDEVVDDCKIDIYIRMRDECEGELDDEVFYDTVNAIKHEVIDYYLSGENYTSINTLVSEYGISGAIQLRIDTHGPLIEAPTLNELLYTIIYDTLEADIAKSSYLAWCELDEH